MKIEILGKGCPRCKATKANTEKALKALGISAEIKEVTDIKEISERVMATPALVVDGEVKCYGRIPGEGEIREWLRSK